MPDYLLEIGTEELPASFLDNAENQLKQAIQDALGKATLDFSAITTMSTPRRLAVVITGLSSQQKNVDKFVKGPPVANSLDGNGKPLSSLLGFAKKHNLETTDLKSEKFGDTEYFVAHLKSEGRPVLAVLSEIIPSVIKQLSGERMMRWGSSDFKFSRPIRWLVSLLDQEVVPFQLADLQAGRMSMGHRTLSSGPIKINSASTYIKDLENNKILVLKDTRKALIKSQVSLLAKELDGQARGLSDSLLDEVANLTEQPTPIVGKFASEYLDLPAALIETIMVHHQRYFPVACLESSVNGESSLLPYFISVANNTAAEAMENIRIGNERVLKARLADGKFFFFDDQKTPLEKHQNALSQLTFQEGLGSYHQKIERLHLLAEYLVKDLKLSAEEYSNFKWAISLSKADLVTNLVRELPELQGLVGAWYAEREGIAPVVVTAIASHYLPRSPEDKAPPDKLGKLISIIDKLDNVAGAFVLGRKPTSSSDPFAVRRHAQGLIEVALACPLDLEIDFSGIITPLISALYQQANSKKLSEKEIVAELSDFLKLRLKLKLGEMGYSREVVEAVTSVKVKDPLSNLPDVARRCQALSSFLAERANDTVLRAGVRVANIVSFEDKHVLDPTQFHEAVEIALLHGYEKMVSQQESYLQKQPLEIANRHIYQELLRSFQPMVELIDRFFDQVMVNDPDPAKCHARRTLLANIDFRFKQVADFAKLQSLLN